MRTTSDLPDCVELGVWTEIPRDTPASFRLKFNNLNNQESQTIKERGVLTFHAVGCTGCHADQQATTKVAAAMAVQVTHPHRFGGTPVAAPASFLYHLGDVVYKKDKETAGDQSPPLPPEKRRDFALLYDTQFYAPYAAYSLPIFAIVVARDGKDRDPDGPLRKSAIHHFLKNFCGLDDGDPPDNQSSSRPPMKRSRRGGSVIVQDSRFGVDMRELTLDGAAALVLDACDQICSLDSLSGLADRACIAELLQSGLLIQDRGLLLSLVLPARTAE
jgi:hypothetical protein